MRLLRSFVAFVLVFCLLAATVAVMSAAAFPQAELPLAEETIVPTEGYDAEDPTVADEKPEIAPTGAETYTPRLKAPAKTNGYYYSDNNIFYKYGYGMPNCTCYAWGRAYEITKKVPSLCVYSAYLWYDYNKQNAIYAYGTKPKLGAIACWVYSTGNAGHVAVVEKIENGTITFSNSAYEGEEFYTSTAPVSDPSDGNKTWIFQGYIYIGDYESDDAAADKPAETAGYVYRITSDDGVNLRSGAGTSYPVVGGITCAETVTVTRLKKAGGYTWGYTTYKNTCGWFVTDYANLLYRVTPTVAPTTTPTTAPTTAPTAAPKPTAAPTTAPKPTVAPTAAPNPTAAPAATPTVTPTEAAKPVSERTIIMGDLDGDSEITIMDATRIQLIVADMFIPTQRMLIAGDYDGDSSFSIMDASRIRIYLAFGI